MAYHFGVPNAVIYMSHIVTGLYLMYVGWTLNQKKELDRYSPYLLMVLGTVSMLYHTIIRATTRRDVMYHFGVPQVAVLIGHLAVGVFLLYVGDTLYNKDHLDVYSPIVLILMGFTAASYQMHIWLTDWD